MNINQKKELLFSLTIFATITFMILIGFTLGILVDILNFYLGDPWFFIKPLKAYFVIPLISFILTIYWIETDWENIIDRLERKMNKNEH